MWTSDLNVAEYIYNWNIGYFAGWINDFLLLLCALVMFLTRKNINDDNSTVNTVENPTFNLNDSV